MSYHGIRGEPTRNDRLPVARRCGTQITPNWLPVTSLAAANVKLDVSVPAVALTSPWSRC